MSDYTKKFHSRKSIRLKGYDYSRKGLYFITICCQDRVCRFGHVEDGIMILNEFGQIANDEWMKLQHRFENFELDAFQIMPNHMHGIIKLNEMPAGSGFIPDQGKQSNHIDRPKPIEAQSTTHNPSIFDIIGAYKSLVSNYSLEIYKSRNQMMGKLWQRSYHEHIIRDERAYENIADYIVNNPQKWEEDKFYNK
jgi:REP element-mobilizing transposase RayT